MIIYGLKFVLFFKVEISEMDVILDTNSQIELPSGKTRDNMERRGIDLISGVQLAAERTAQLL